MIGVLDYGVGNVRAFKNVYTELGIPFKSICQEKDFNDTTHIILPGVGSFDYAMTSLNKSGLKEKLNYLVLNEKMPVLGVCVGMQMMGHSSQEGKQKGLSWLNAESKIIAFDEANNIDSLPLPHMGWNSIEIHKKNQLLEGIQSTDYFYFLHSYYLSCNDRSIICAETRYGSTVTSLVQKDNIYGVQQHPEKSHDAGIKVLQNFWRV